MQEWQHFKHQLPGYQMKQMNQMVEEDYWSDTGLVEALETLDLADGFRDHDYDD